MFSDGPRDATVEADVQAVRAYVATLSGFKSVQVVKRTENLGLATSIIRGVSEVLGQHDRVIVVEDDLVTSPHFLRYMNDALELYETEDRVVSIHAYVYPVTDRLPETFFLRGADCWGWATWRRGWQLFRADGETLLAELRQSGLSRLFDFEGSFGYMRMLEDQIAGLNDSWAIRWYASAFLRNKLTLYPGRSLVHNIGNDASGSHLTDTSAYDVKPTAQPIPIRQVAVEDSAVARGAFERFGRRQSRPSLRAILRHLASRSRRRR